MTKSKVVSVDGLDYTVTIEPECEQHCVTVMCGASLEEANWADWLFATSDEAEAVFARIDEARIREYVATSEYLWAGDTAPVCEELFA